MQLKGKGQQLKGTFSHSSYRDMLKMGHNRKNSTGNESATLISSNKSVDRNNFHNDQPTRIGSCGGGSIEDYAVNYSDVASI